MRSNFDLFLYAIAIVQCFRIYGVNGECCKPATLGLCGDPSTFRPNMCADCTIGNPHCGVGDCNAEGCDCEGGCRAGMCVPNSICDRTECNLIESIFHRSKRQSSNSGKRDYQLTAEDAASAIISMIDRDGDGKLSQYEIYYYSAKVRRLNLSNNTFEEEFKALDTNHDGFVTDSEIHLSSEDKSTDDKKKPRKNSGAEVLEEAGKDENGVLNMTEAYEYFSKHSRVPLTKAALEAEIKSLDKNNDGTLSESELEPKNSSII